MHNIMFSNKLFLTTLNQLLSFIKKALYNLVLIHTVVSNRTYLIEKLAWHSILNLCHSSR